MNLPKLRGGRPLGNVWRWLAVMACGFAGGTPAATVPAGFEDSLVSDGWSAPVGLLFTHNAADTAERMLVWEKGGRVWIVEDGVRQTTPLLDLTDEVGNYRDYGLTGVVLHPNFRQNGWIYLFYVVDRHHLRFAGTPTYNPAANEYYNATIARITRYTMRADDDFRSVDPASRKVLLGETKSTGMPVLHTSHGSGTLAFGEDGTLLASCGDGASFDDYDRGGNTGNSYGVQALADGIITAAENVGAYRCQMLDSLSGKILRLDPVTGDGVPSNPFYQPGIPRSPRSRVYALGLRNPYRFSVKPETGEHDPADGYPGTLMVGDVGWITQEEMNVIDRPGQNFGWPLYEGILPHPGYKTGVPAGLAAIPVTLPRAEWRAAGRVRRAGQTVALGTGSAVPEVNLTGNCSVGGVWYEGTDFPAEWQHTWFHADFGGQWIAAMNFDSNSEVNRVRMFASGAGPVVYAGADPHGGGIVYIAGNAVRKVSWIGTANRAPVALATADRTWGFAALPVHFSAAGSTDPEGGALTYTWDFGDGTAVSHAVAPEHVYSSPAGGSPVVRTATLTVRDAAGQAAVQTLAISLNNTPPVARITSPARGARYPLGHDSLWSLAAEARDGETESPALTRKWQVFLHHNDHEHAESVLTEVSPDVVLSPLGCNGESYFYRIVLQVTDAGGLTATDEVKVYPDCGGPVILTNADAAACRRYGAVEVDVLANDEGPVEVADRAALEISLAPASGTATVDPSTGRVTYRHGGNTAATDSFQYRVRVAGSQVWSAPGTVRISLTGGGIAAEFFSDVTLTTSVLTRSDPEIGFNWNNGSPDPAVPADRFSARWRGRVLPPASGAFTFYTYSDDGTRLRVNGQLIVDDWTVHLAAVRASAPVVLTAGQPVDVELEYFDNTGPAGVFLDWSGPGFARVTIPASSWLPPNEAPVAMPDHAAFLPGMPVRIPVLANDTDDAGALVPGSLQIVRPPAAGTVSVDAAGVVTFTAAAGAGNADGFSYQVSDSAGAVSAPVEVALTRVAAPAVSLTSPVAEAVVAPGLVPVNWSVSGYAAGYDAVQILLDGTLVHAGDLSGSLTLSAVAAGPHTLTARLLSGGVPLTNAGATAIRVFFAGTAGGFAAWSAVTPGASGLPDGNADADLYPDLLEFLLGSDPADGAAAEGALQLLVVDDAPVPAITMLQRPGLSLSLEVSRDLRTWADSGIAAVVAGGTSQHQTLRWPGVSALPGLADAGFVRLRVRSTDPAASVTSRPLGWYRVVLSPLTASFGASLLEPAIFAGTVGAWNGATGVLTPAAGGFDTGLAKAGRTCYLEFTAGALEGHRIDLRALPAGVGVVPLDLASPHNTLASPAVAAGMPFVIRPHHTLAGLLPPGGFHAATSPLATDQVNLHHPATGWETLSVVDPGTGPQWARAGDPFFADEGSRVILPGQGLLATIRGGRVPLLVCGEVRGCRFIQTLGAGGSFISEGFPLPATPESRGLTLTSGFTGGLSLASADQLHVWDGGGWVTWFLLDAGPGLQHWVRSGDATLRNASVSELFLPGRAVFLQRQAPVARAWDVPLPSAPTPTDDAALWLAAQGLVSWNADPDEDQMPTLMEYALGSDPALTDSVSRPEVILTGGRLAISVPLPGGRGIAWTLESSPDLHTWTAAAGVTEAQGGQLVLREAAAGSARRYLRARVSLTESAAP